MTPTVLSSRDPGTDGRAHLVVLQRIRGQMMAQQHIAGNGDDWVGQFSARHATVNC